jgi:hypothetical protein
MEAALSFETSITSIPLYQSTLRHNSKDCELNIHYFPNFKSLVCMFLVKWLRFTNKNLLDLFLRSVNGNVTDLNQRVKQASRLGRVRLKPDGTRWRTGGRGNWRMEWVASTLHTTSEHGVSSITTADAHTSGASSRLNWRPRRFQWTHPFRRKTKSGFCACAITFQTHSTG